MFVEHKMQTRRDQISEYAGNNMLLAQLLAADEEIIGPRLELISLSIDKSIYTEGDEIEFVYFPIDSLISSLAVLEDGATVEISMVGREGMAGISAILGTGATRLWVRSSIAGLAVRLHARTLQISFARNEEVMRTVLSNYLALISQISQRSVCNARHTVLERFCCWLLMVHDRLGGKNLKLTQETIASRLGARRAGITVAARLLQQQGAIEYQRGQLHVTNRHLLEQSACECYPILRAEFMGVRSWDGFARRPPSILGSL
jgi:CRP-like cAMP-binding protein